MAGDPMRPLISSGIIYMGPPMPAGIKAGEDFARMFAPKPVVAKPPDPLGPDIKVIVPKRVPPVVMNLNQAFPQQQQQQQAQINIGIPNQATGQGSSPLPNGVQGSMLAMTEGPPMMGSMLAMQQGPPMMGSALLRQPGTLAGLEQLAQGVSDATLVDLIELLGTGSPVGFAKRAPCASRTFTQTVTSTKWYPEVRIITQFEIREDEASKLFGGRPDNAIRLKELTKSIEDLAWSDLKNDFDFMAAQGDCMNDGCAAEEEWCDVASYTPIPRTFAWLPSVAAPPAGSSIGRTLKSGDPDVAGWHQAQVIFEITCSCQA